MKSAKSLGDDRFFLVLMIFCLALHFIFICIGFTNPPNEHHGFRQTQTAISVFYLLHEGFRIDYITPVLGKPWAIPMEFPIYQYLSAAITSVTRLGLETVSRSLSVAFCYLTFLFSYNFLCAINVSRGTRYFAVSLFACSPIYIFFPVQF